MAQVSGPSSLLSGDGVPQIIISQDETTSFPNRTSPDHLSEHEMGRGPRLEVLVDSECIFLKGTGSDVEPARLSGHVALHLTESTAIKEITLQFRGKARLRPTQSDSLSTLNTLPSTYVICNHDWSFLEGEKKHSHTLKAGRHLFPFQIQLGGSLPSTITTDAFGGASVAYKLRAHAVRSGLHNNLQAVTPISIVRSFTPEALEYQQTSEIENTWPEKLMYSIMIPHKAWAAGDKLTVLVKFSPLVKGVRILSMNTGINETTKVTARSGFQEHTCSVASVKHEIVGGKAVEVDEYGKRIPNVILIPGQSIPNSPTTPSSSLSSMTRAYPPSPLSPLSIGSSSFSEAGPSSSSSTTSDLNLLGGIEESHRDVVTSISMTVPLTITPTHTLNPITVSHRIRWNVLINNLDGHTSELRCSLPIHLLDYRLLDESRHHTSATRRLLLGGPEEPSETEDDMELPSYTAHVRDRVANMFLPEAATMRVSNPWIQNGISPTMAGRTAVPNPTQPRSGGSSPLEAQVLSYFPDAPGPGNSTPLDGVNSELCLSLQEQIPPPLSQRTTANPNSSRRPPATSRPSTAESVADTPSVAGPNETYVHRNQASDALPSLFHASAMPVTLLPRAGWLSSRSNTHPHPTPHTTTLDQNRQQVQPRVPAGVSVQDRYRDWPSLLHRAFTEVPDYRVALRGFIGGVPPLTSMRGLPSYAEAETSRRDSSFSTQLSPALSV